MQTALKGVPVQEPTRAGRRGQRRRRVVLRRLRARRAASSSLGLDDKRGADAAERRGAQQHPRPVQALSAAGVSRRRSASGSAGLLRCAQARQAGEELARRRGSSQRPSTGPEVEAAGLRRQPDLLQRRLRVDDDLAAVREGELEQAAGALVVDVDRRRPAACGRRRLDARRARARCGAWYSGSVRRLRRSAGQCSRSIKSGDDDRRHGSVVAATGARAPRSWPLCCIVAGVRPEGRRSLRPVAPQPPRAVVGRPRAARGRCRVGVALMACPARPTRPPRRRALRRRLAARRPGAPLGTPLFVYSSAVDARRARRLPARASPAATPDLLRDEGELDARRAAVVRAPRLRLRHRLGRRARARARGRRRCRRRSSSPASARRAPRCAQRARAGIGCFNVESDGRARTCSTGRAREPARARRSACASTPTSTRDASVHLDRPKGNKFGIAHERGARGLPRAPRRCRGSRSSASTATSARRSPTAGPYLDAIDACSTWSRRSKRDGIPLRHIDFGGGLGINYNDETPPPPTRSCARLLARIDARGFGDRKLLFEPGARWSAMPACCVTEVLYLKPARRRTSASSTRR